MHHEERRVEELPDHVKVAEVAVKEVLSGPEAEDWKLSIIDEFNSLIKKKT